MTQTVAGTRWEAKYESSFANQPAATETVTYAKQADAKWQPTGYDVQPAKKKRSRARVFLAFLPALLAVVWGLVFGTWPRRDQSDQAARSAEAAGWTNHIRLKQFLAPGTHGSAAYGDADFRYEIVFDEKSVALTASYRKQDDAQYRVQIEDKNGQRRALGEGGSSSTARREGGHEIVAEKKMLSRAEFERMAALILQKRVTGPGAEAATFGPVIERVLNGSGEKSGLQGLDFESGNVLTAAATVRSGAALWKQWIAGQGVDLLASQKGGDKWQLGGLTIKLASASEAWWESAPMSELHRTLDEVGMEEQEGLYFLSIRSDGGKPLTFAFQTGSGAIGLLQITGFTDNPRGVKLRYKLVQQTAKGETEPEASVGEVGRLKLQFAEEQLKETEKRLEVGAATPLDYLKSKLARDIAASERKRDPVEVARLKLQFAEQELQDAKHRLEVGAMTPSDYQKMEFARDIAAAELKGDSVEAARLRLQVAELELTVADKKRDVGQATQVEYEQAKLARDIAAINLQRVQKAKAQ